MNNENDHRLSDAELRHVVGGCAPVPHDRDATRDASYTDPTCGRCGVAKER